MLLSVPPLGCQGPLPILDQSSDSHCLGRGETLAYYVLIPLCTANDHPERHHEERYVGLLAAWSEAFPCPEWG